ncbi:MAG TPA: galactokinase family protein [Blastocatellia bacterium]|nr:galactokinase family protein [Blastocatellia bacterium]
MEQTRLSEALRRFKELYGDGEAQVLRAPARINILGEHVDYVSYMPTASLAFGSREHEMLMLFRATDDGQVRGASALEKFPPFGFALDEEEIEDHASQTWESLVFNRPAPAPHWSNYVKGAVSFARWKYGAGVRRGFNFLIESSIPPNSGASSSSALVTLAGAAIRMANRIEYEPVELARDSSEAEWFMGTRGGALDHTTICLAQRGRLVHISHQDQRAELIPLQADGFRWITFFSHESDKGREAMLEYNERAAISRLLIPALLARSEEEPGFQMPETITLDEIARLDPQTFHECERAFPALVDERRNQPLKLENRKRHHISEAVIVNAAVALLTETPPSVDARMRALGRLMNISHMSLRNWYEVSTPEVEALIAVISADSHVHGARLMGGGFGGNVLALTTAENTQALIDRAQNEFYGPRGRDGFGEGSVMVSTPGNGLELLNL